MTFHLLRSPLKSLISIILFDSVLFLTLVLKVTTASAYHPLITDDTGTQGKGRFQYEFNVEYGYDKEAGIKTEELTVNNTLTYGITDTIDLAIGIPYAYWKEEDGGSIDEDGLSDIELAVKYRFYEAERLRLALKPSITIPSGDSNRGLGTGRVTGRLFLIVDKEFEDFTLFFNVGYIRNENKVGERSDLWHISLAGEYKIKEALKIALNTGVERNPEPDSNTSPAFLLGGLVYSVTEAFDLSAAIKAGLNKPETDWAGLAGITLRF